MKVLFIYVDTQTSSWYQTGLGIASISGYLKTHGVKTELVYYRTDDDFNYAMEKIVEHSPDIVGFYSTSVNWQTVHILSREIRKQFPEILQIYGGVHATLVPEVLSQIESLDAICVGYGEVPMLELVEHVKNKKDIFNISGLWVRQRKGGIEKIIQNPPYFPSGNYDELLTFDYHLFLEELSRFQDFDLHSYRLEIIFNRNCPFHCSFCCNHKLQEIYSHRLFTPSPEASIKALKAALQSTHFKFVEIHDDILTLNKAWFYEFIKLYAREISIPFVCNLRADSFDEDDVKLLKEANIYAAWIGIESGNDYIRNKIMNKNVASEKILRAVELLHHYNIRVRIQNIIGVPGETPAHFIDTIRMNAKCWPGDVYLLSFFYPYPKTELYELCIREKLIKENYNIVKERMHPVLNLPYFSEKKMLFYFHNFSDLIKYQHYRELWPHIFLIPLTDQTSRIIIWLIYLWRTMNKAMHKGLRLIFLRKAKQTLKFIFRKVLSKNQSIAKVIRFVR